MNGRAVLTRFSFPFQWVEAGYKLASTFTQGKKSFWCFSKSLAGLESDARASHLLIHIQVLLWLLGAELSGSGGQQDLPPLCTFSWRFPTSFVLCTSISQSHPTVHPPSLEILADSYSLTIDPDSHKFTTPSATWNHFSDHFQTMRCEKKGVWR